jgi:Tfp pilus assembly protein PilX
LILRRLRQNENGFALVLALGVLTVLSIASATAVYYTSTASRSSDYQKAGQNSYALAESGVSTMLSILNTYFQPATGSALPDCTKAVGSGGPVTVTVSTGSYTYCGTISGTTWTLKSTGTVRNPTGAKGSVSRTITRQVSIAGLNSGATLAAWSRIYSDDSGTCPGGGLVFPAGVPVQGNVGVKGDLCINGTSITGGTSSVQVGGKVVLTPTNVSGGNRFPVAATGWTSSSNVTADDNVVATTGLLAVNAASANLDATGFGFAIPSNATIVGIAVSVERYGSPANLIKDNNVQLLKAGVPVGNNKAGATTWAAAGAGGKGAAINYGTASDLWGTTWTPADVNASNFGLRFSAKNSSATTQASANLDEVDITITYAGEASIGQDSANPVQEVDVLGTCKWSATAAQACSAANANANHVWAGGFAAPSPWVGKPLVDFSYWYDNAAPGPKHGCDVSSGTPPTFDSNSTYDGGNSEQELTPESGHDSPGADGGVSGTNMSYTCKAKDAQGNVIGELSWNMVTRVLTVKGTIFFDGNAVFHDHNGYVVHYQGKATIYVAKKWHNDEAVCAGGSGITTCRTTAAISSWDPTQNLLVIIAGGKNNAGDADWDFHTDYSAFQGVLYAKNDCDLKDSAMLSGPILCNNLAVSGTPGFYAWPPLGSLLPGQMYGSTTTSTDFLVQVGNQSG